MISQLKKDNLYLICIAYIIIGVLTIMFFQGTGDSGDSIAHFLHAKYALKHPHLFFSHWGKSIFTLLSFPFAQFGFAGMKVFNLLVSLATMALTYQTARHLKYPNYALIGLLWLFAPLVFVLTFSGLTEPLLALRNDL